MQRTLLLALVFVLTGTASGVTQDRIAGVPTVIDGDTLQIRGVSIRLHGIDAPEPAQICTRNGVDYGCGLEATWWLSRALGGRSVTCVRGGTDHQGRMVATCSLGNKDVGRVLVQHGHALAEPGPGGEIYREDQRRARAQLLGMHAACFYFPWSYREHETPL